MIESKKLSATRRRMLSRYALAPDGTLAVAPSTRAIIRSLVEDGLLRRFGEYEQWQITDAGRATLDGI